MTMMVDNQCVVFVGKVKDLKNIFNGFPGDTTLLEFIKLHLN